MKGSAVRFCIFGLTVSSAWANGHATTISVLIHGTLRVTFHIGATPQTVTLQKEGDYVIFGPDTVHSWEASGHTPTWRW